jgi:hypothetical protein
MLRIVMVVLKDLGSKVSISRGEHFILKVRKQQIAQRESSTFSFTGNVEDSCGSLEGPGV